jgi:HSP20 family protein
MAGALTRWDPVAELASMRNAMDRLFEQSLGRPFFRVGRADEDFEPVTLGLDVYETANDYIVKAAVPGVDPKDIEITVDDDVLTIRGEMEQKDEAAEGQYLRREIRYGRFERSLRLPPTVDAEHAHAHFEHGMLKLTLPKKPEARSRTIKITADGVIEGEKQS